MSSYPAPNPPPPVLGVYNELNWYSKEDPTGPVGPQGVQGGIGIGVQGFQGNQGLQGGGGAGTQGPQGWQGGGGLGTQGPQGFQGTAGGGGGTTTYNFYSYGNSLSANGYFYTDTIGATTTTKCVRYTLNGQYQGSSSSGDGFQLVIRDNIGVLTTTNFYNIVNAGVYNAPFQIVATVGNNPTTSNTYYLNIVLQIGGEWNAASPPTQNCLVGSINCGPTIPFARSMIGNTFQVGYNFASSGTVYLISALKELF